MKSERNHPMAVTPQCVVALTWTLKDTLGEALDELDEPVEFYVGGTDLLAKIEEALQGHQAGDTVDLHLEPIDAFGDYDDKLLFLEPRERFPDDVDLTGLEQGGQPRRNHPIGVSWLGRRRNRLAERCHPVGRCLRQYLVHRSGREAHCGQPHQQCARRLQRGLSGDAPCRRLRSVSR